jgi:hypothetical protein
MKIRRDIRYIAFIAPVNDTGDMLFSGVNDTGIADVIMNCPEFFS